ncbi:MAG TPA: hypothetical protein VNY09_07460 [Candidatus Sulfotelmatobacter sp.]|nr:hypothetical protein [Candidatus Sulfotelmatobacter sp.]
MNRLILIGEKIGSRWPVRRLALLIFAASCLIYAVSPQGRPRFSDLAKGAEISRVALSVARDGSFANPFYPLPTGYTAHAAPVYVLLYAFVAKIFGAGWMGARVLWALNVGFLALQLALMPVLSDRLGLGVFPGALAAVLGVIVQPYRVLPEWESLFTGALLITLCVMTLRYFKMPGDWRRSLLFGLLWGVAILTNPECVLLMFAWAHISAMENSRETLSRARRAMVWVVAGAAIACLPWFVRNYRQFHSVFFVRDNLGTELYTSNNPCARPTTLENVSSGCHAATHPNTNADLDVEVIEKGEVRFNQQALHRALSWIASNPRAFAALTARRFARFWFPYLGSFRYSIPMGFLTALSVLGLFWMYRENRTAALLFASTLLVYPLIHYIVQFEARYRYPIFWATLIPAAYAFAKIIPWPRNEATDKAPARVESELISV